MRVRNVLKRAIPAVIAAVAAVMPAQAREPQRGYRGFAEWETNISEFMFDSEEFFIWLHEGVSTSHGYQFNPHLFVGGGVLFESGVLRAWDWLVPVFAHVRTDQKWGSFTPFGDLRIGYNFVDARGIYFSPTIGYHFDWGRRVGLNLGVGMTLRQFERERYQMTLTPDENGGLHLNTVSQGKRHETRAMLTVRVGIDF